MEGDVSWEPGAPDSILFLPNVALACTESGLTKLWLWGKEELGQGRRSNALSQLGYHQLCEHKFDFFVCKMELLILLFPVC